MKKRYYLAAIVLLHACIKDPHPPLPPESPKALLVKTVRIESWSTDGEDQTFEMHEKYVDEYLYNGQNKPVARRRYSSNFTGDTNQLTYDAYDTLFYDSRGRVKQVDFHDLHYQKQMSSYRFFYQGAATLIDQYELWTRWNNPHADTLTFNGRMTFKYVDSGVFRILPYPNGTGIDTIFYAYRNNNFQYISFISLGLQPDDYHVEYDNKPNASECFNLPQPTMVFPLPSMDVVRPLADKNNYIVRERNNNEGAPRILTYDTLGHPIHMLLPSPETFAKMQIRLEYRLLN